jgi:hypothetical protein
MALVMRSLRSRLWGGVHPLLSLLLLPLLPLAACAFVAILISGFFFSELLAASLIALGAV